MNQQLLHQVPIDELKGWLQSQNEPAFRAKQIFEWVWKRAATSFDEMTNVGLSLREKLAGEFSLTPLQALRTERSDDAETTKYLWKLSDDRLVESVLIEAPGRVTVCVSSQVGCPVRCAFCASGRAGFVRNLSAAEIVAQVLFIQKELLCLGKKVSHVVFMGMGEPLRNYEAVVSAIRALIDPNRFGISQRRITLSTVGVVEGIRALSKEGLGINLAFSLHAPTQDIRKKIIPYAREYELFDILKALEEYRAETGRDITYEYILLSGINDSPQDAHTLVRTLRARKIITSPSSTERDRRDVEDRDDVNSVLLTRNDPQQIDGRSQPNREVIVLRALKAPCSVNLIPYNPVPGVSLKRPDTSIIDAFRDILIKGGIVTTCRFTKGRDIAAACGQLVLQEKDHGNTPAV